ncbi:MAG: polysaccharide biosynthesis tyrosine autokinase [Acidobacteria bacterium]|nr:polysaccharide biosynthesis tyrosine autokinase [Acidobacteriota bacterium]
MPKISDPAPSPATGSPATSFELPSSTMASRSLVDFRRVLFARKYLILIVVVCAVILSIIYAQTRTPLYEATATAEVDLPRSESMGLSSAVASLYSDDATTTVQTQAFRLTGHSLIYRAITELSMEHRGPYPDALKNLVSPGDEDSLPPVQREEMISSVLESLSVSLVPKTNALRVTYRHPDPKVARDLVNRLLSVFMERSVEDRLLGTTQASNMLSNQMNDLKKHAADAQQRLADFQKQHNLIGTDEKDNLTTAGLRIINEQLAEAQADQIIKQARLRLVQSSNPELLTSVAPTPTLQSLRSQETQVKVELGELTSKYGPGYPKVHELQSQLATLDKAIATESSNITRRAREEYAASSSTVESLQHRLKDQTQQAFKLNESAAQYAILRQDAESSRDLFNALQLKLKESSVSAALGAESISIIDHAVTPDRPIEPNKRRIVETGTLAGVILAIFLALGLETLNDSVRTSEDVETSSQFESLGAVPHFDANAMTTISSSSGTREVPTRLVAFAAPDSLSAEAFRSIRSAIMLSSLDKRSKVITVTSSYMNEGKSTVSANLAISFAQHGARVLLVDTDLRRSHLHFAFRIPGRLPGLTSLLSFSGSEDVFLTPIPELPNLVMLPAGRKPPNPAEVLGSGRMGDLIDQWRKEYDYIIIDTAPILMVSDALGVASRADGTVMIVRARLTRKKAITRAFELLSRSRVRIIGAVINDVDLNLENFYTYARKGYGYMYYSGKGQEPAYGHRDEDQE